MRPTNFLNIENIKKLFIDLLPFYTEKELAAVLNIPYREISQLLISGNAPYSTLCTAFESMGITSDNAFNGNYDIGCIILKLNGINDYIPMKYRDVTLSRRGITNGLIEIAALTHGKQIIDQVQTHFQIGSEFLGENNYHMPVSTFLNKDILDYLQGIPTDIFKIGSDSISLAQLRGERIFRGLKTSEMYEKVISEVVSKVDQSHEYTVKEITSTKAVFHKSYTEQMLELTKGETQSSNSEDIFTMGYGAAVPYVEKKEIATPTMRQIKPGVVEYEFHFAAS